MSGQVKELPEKPVSRPSIGPYPAHDAASITEKLLDSKDLYVNIEQLLRGDLSVTSFLWRIQIAAEDAHTEILENAEYEKNWGIG